MNEPAIKINNVSVKYRLAKEKPKTLQEYIIHRLKGKRMDYEDFWALRHINIEVSRGETLGIIGHNGAGKSTLLKVIAGVLKPTDGNVMVNGKIAPLIELGAGFDMELTGKENIYLNASILGLSRKEIDKKLNNIVEFSELGEFIYSPLKNYSSGMVSRLGFSIATEVDPEILIIDEILAVGDERFNKKCMERMTGFKEKGTTILFVSHGMDEIERLCDRVLWLDHGRQRMLGDPESITEEYHKA
jgi:ABC-2 type transport system ATP-binding protein/lipopolysaccharide transport system ATP-binding protein